MELTGLIRHHQIRGRNGHAQGRSRGELQPARSAGSLAIGDVIDFADITAGPVATIGYSGQQFVRYTHRERMEFTRPALL